MRSLAWEVLDDYLEKVVEKSPDVRREEAT
jgi:hypothetical protein